MSSNDWDNVWNRTPGGPAEQADPESAPDAEPEGEPEGSFEPFSTEPEGSFESPNAQPPFEPQRFHAAYDNGAYADPQFTVRPAQNDVPRYEQQASQSPERKVKKYSGGFFKKAVALALICALLGGAAGFGGALLANRVQNGSAKSGASSIQIASPRETTELNVVTVDSGRLLTANQVYKANVNSTVGITTEIITTNFWGYQSTGAAAGSGFVLSEDGYILTNEHVIDKARTITVAMYDGSTYPAKLVGYDTANDIAVLKIEAEGLIPVTLGDSNALEVGDEVIAIGNPLGELTFSLTKGNVSALNRAVTLSSSVTMNLIQTDAAINSGNSGGALFNMYGEVVGITNAKYSSSGYSGEASIDNIGFAIPINSVREIVTSIIEKGYISTPYIGVSVGNVSEESQNYGMPRGAAVRAVEDGSPAAQAGLQPNDIITAVNGEAITAHDELASAIVAAEIGSELKLTVYRRGETLTITVTVGERIQDALADQNTQEQAGSEQSGGQSGGGSDPWGWGGFPWGWGFGG